MRWVWAAAVGLGALGAGLACPANSSLSRYCACDPNSFNGVLLECVAADAGPVFAALRQHKAALGLIQHLAIRNSSLPTLHHNLFKGLYIKKLELTNNGISTVESKAFAGLENILQSLSLRDNALDRLPSEALEGMSALLALDLSHNRITDLTMREAFESLPKLYDLNLAHNRICDIYKGAFDAIKHSVQTLNLGHNCLSKVPAAALRGFRQLLALHLDHNEVGFVDPLHFMNLPGLNLLNLAGNGIRGLHRMAFLNVPNLRLLYLADNNLTEVKRGEFLHMEALEMLDLTRNRLSRLPPYAFANMTRLSQLYLGENGLEEIGENAFANASLTMLLLPYNRLHHLPARSFQWMHHLQQLSLKNNSMSSIAQNAFFHMPSLVMVDLSHNRLSELLPGTFLHQLNLFLVDLSNNNIQLAPYNAFNHRTATVVLKENPLVCTERVHLIQKGQGVFVPDTVDRVCGARPRLPPPRLPAHSLPAQPPPAQPLPAQPPPPQTLPPLGNLLPPQPTLQPSPAPSPGQPLRPIIRPIGGDTGSQNFRPLFPAPTLQPLLPAPAATPSGGQPTFIGPQAHFSGFWTEQPQTVPTSPAQARPAFPGLQRPHPPSPDTWGKEHLIPSQADIFAADTTTLRSPVAAPTTAHSTSFPLPPQRSTLLPFPVPFLNARNLPEASHVSLPPTTTPEATLPPGIVTASRAPVQTGLPVWTEPKPQPVDAVWRTKRPTTPFPVKTVPPKKKDIYGNPFGSEPAVGGFDNDGSLGATGTGSATTTIAVCLTVVVMVMVAVFITLCVVRHRSSQKRSESSASRTSAYVAAQAARVGYAASNYGTASLARLPPRPATRASAATNQAWIYAPGPYASTPYGHYG